jgi:hypothetical protein
VQETFDPLAYEVGFSRVLVASHLGEFDHQVIRHRDGDLRHGHIMPQIEVQSSLVRSSRVEFKLTHYRKIAEIVALFGQ